MRDRVKGRLVEESAATITRTSPRRRKLALDEEADELQEPSLTSKRSKKRTVAAESVEEAVESKAKLQDAQGGVNSTSIQSSRRRRPESVHPKEQENGVQGTELEAEGQILNGNVVGTPTRKRKIQESSKNNKLKAKRVKANKEEAEEAEEAEEEVKALDTSTPKKRKRKTTVDTTEIKEQDTGTDNEEPDINNKTPQKATRKRKTKEEKETDAMPLAPRTPGLRMYVGAHVSMAKGLQNAITNSHHIGANAFALFLKSQRKWDNPPLTPTTRDAFRTHCTSHHYDPTSHILPHGSYLVNLAQEDPSKASQAYSAFLDDLHRCESLNIKLYNFHPGATGPNTVLPTALARIAKHLNAALSATTTVTPLLENMSGAGTVIGSRFSELASLIALIDHQHRARIGVCLDTCHAFAAGYDLRTLTSFRAVLADFDATVGLQYLKALHLNDSKAPLGSRRDLHQNIGLGFLGLRAFHHVMNERRFEGLPLILETPCERPEDGVVEAGKKRKMVEDKGVWAREIKLLEGLVGMDVEGGEFKRLERELAEMGRAEREEMLRGVERREGKGRKKIEKEKEKGQSTLEGLVVRAGGVVGKGKGRGRAKDKVKGESSGEEGASDSEGD